jgi:PncC family amidohydrolase
MKVIKKLNVSQESDEYLMLERLKSLFLEFKKRRVRISIAESCSGGYISHMITNISGASKVFERGIVAYSNESKVDILRVDNLAIEKYGAVSEKIAKQMAEGIRRISKTEIGIGITGIAGPTGGTKLKPVGLVYIAYSYKNHTLLEKYNFKTNRIEFKKKVLNKIIAKLENLINEF